MIVGPDDIGLCHAHIGESGVLLRRLIIDVEQVELLCRRVDRKAQLGYLRLVGQNGPLQWRQLDDLATRASNALRAAHQTLAQLRPFLQRRCRREHTIILNPPLVGLCAPRRSL